MVDEWEDFTSKEKRREKSTQKSRLLCIFEECAKRTLGKAIIIESKIAGKWLNFLVL